MVINIEMNGTKDAYIRNGIDLSNGVNGMNGINGINGTNGVNHSNHWEGANGISHTSHWEGTNGTKSCVDGLKTVHHTLPSSEPIAIVGMAMRLPGGVSNGDAFWDLLMEKRDGRCRVPEDRYNVDAFYNESGKPGTVRMKHGHFLQNNLKHLDTSFFSMTRSETEKLDPQARLLLEVSREALENAGETQWRGKAIGCYVGVFGEDWQDIHLKDSQDSGMYRVTGYGDFLLGNRISYEYHLKGPSMTIKTGCSSSLIALHLACQALHSEECTAAIVGGTNLIMSPTMTIAMSEQGVLSADAACKTFDGNADGYARGEAINALYIKKLSHALRDGNPIQAVIRSTATNSDGRTPGISHPSSESHEALIRRAHEVAGLKDIAQTALVECHGTGTSIGDPLETKAVANCFEDSGVYIGSVKPNVGHSEGASGITSVIKAVLALKHKTIPPNINFSTPNPKIPFGQLRVPIEPTPWPRNRAERVCVNSFGLGGANAHAIIESAASLEPVVPPTASLGHSSGSCPRTQLLVFSANHTNSLRKNVENFRRYLKEKPRAVGDLAYTLGARREHLPYRTFCVTDGFDFSEVAPSVKPQVIPQLNFVFTGQGGQWLGMGRELIKNYISVSEDIKTMDEALMRLPHPPTWSIREELLRFDNKSEDSPNLSVSSRFNTAELSQPLCTAVQVALVNLLGSWGIKPVSVIGHSSGEIAGAYAAGALTLRDAIIIAYYRGVVTKKQTRRGGMAAVGLPKEDIIPYLIDGTVVACENSPNSVTISGDLEKVEIIMAAIKEKFPAAFVRPLRVEMAYHSYHMREIGAEYQSLIEDYVTAGPTTIPFYSSVSGHIITPKNRLTALYWRQNLESPVLFSTAVQSLLGVKSADQMFLEIGPHSTLQGPLRQIFKAVGMTKVPYVSALQRNVDSIQSLLAAVGQLYLRGIPIDFPALSPGVVLTDLPTYCWNHEEEYWDESRLCREWRLRQFPHHDILGSRVTESSDLEPIWRNVLRLDNVPWIRDHRIASNIIFPGAGYVAMAGEAIRQITKKETYSVRQVVISSAMIMNETNATELLTTLRPARLTMALDSAWYDFSIASHNGTTWTKHCIGHVRAGPDHESPMPFMHSLPRTVSASRWYRAMRKVGLNYGRRFQGLMKISTSTRDSIALASMQDVVEPHESTYQLHPSTIDLCIQLFSAAASNGLARNLKQLSVPSFIEYLYIGRPENEMQMSAKAFVSPRGNLTGNGAATAAGKVVLEIRGLKLTPLEDESDMRGADRHAATRLHWKPDIAFLKIQDLLRPAEKNLREFFIPVEKLALLCMIETSYRLASSTSNDAYLNKYRSWLCSMRSYAEAGKNQIVEDAANLIALTSEQRLVLVDAVAKQISSTPTKLAGLAIMRIFDASLDIFHGKVDPLEVLLKDNVLAGLYNMGDRWDFHDFFAALSHAKPSLRVLEIGAGTGGTTSIILDQLVSGQGERMFSTYHYTDISAGFFPMAKERFSEARGMKYSVLDISKDPLEQGFEEASYDLIIATNVLHATPKISETLRNVRQLLRTDGYLFLDELCSTAKWLNYIMGTLPGWWLGETDGRSTEPYMSPKLWAMELKEAGFSEPSAVVEDDERPYQSNALIVASPAPSTTIIEKRVTLLCESEESLLVRGVLDDFQAAGFNVDLCSLLEEPVPNQDIVSLLDLDTPFFENITEDTYTRFIKFVLTLKSIGLLWVTRASQIQCTDPRFAQALGLARAVRNELVLDMATLELDSCDKTASRLVLQVFNKFQHRKKSSDYEPDFEFVVEKGVIHIPRFHWFSVSQELSKSTQKGPKRLEIGKRGFLKTLGWVQYPEHRLTGDQVSVDVRAVGMNFKDVLIAMGIVEGHVSEGNGLGCECAGIVRQIGPEAKNVAVGDRVFVFGGGSYSTRLTTASRLCVKMADSLSFEDAATMPCVYSTVIYSLIHLGRLQTNQTVLIHSACGGIGIAAIQICKMIGATIFATVGNDDKIAYLVDTFGIPKEHIFNSRNTSFLPGVMHKTHGRGVDLVLNSLSGELLHASWQCVAEFGSMVEIGKRDFIGRAKLSMEVFESNRAFFGVDFAQICVDRPEITQSVLEECMDYYRKGLILPIRPIMSFEATQIQEAFRFMQKGQHIGKIVVNMPENSESLPVTDATEDLHLRPDVSYLLVGGLGGLGRSISTWMVERGARHLIYLSRSAGKSVEDQAFFDELKSQGCSTQAFVGSVNNLNDVRHAVNQAEKTLAGVIQMSMVLRDGQLDKMSFADWEAAVSPKVQGTWNLHEATLATPLDFFVLFGSFSGLVGQRGQANYASANTFLDAFVQYRHGKHLPASVLDIGPIEDVGYVSNNKQVLDQFRATSLYILSEQDLLDSLHLIVKSSFPAPQPSEGYVNTSQVGIGLRMTVPSNAPNNRCIWKRDVRMSLYPNIENAESSTDTVADAGLRQFLITAEADSSTLQTPESEEFLASEFGKTLFGFLLLPLEEMNPKQAISSLGVDSLVAIELRNWCRHKLGIDLTVLELLDVPTMEDFGKIAAQKLYAKFAGVSEETVRESFLQMKAP